MNGTVHLKPRVKSQKYNTRHLDQITGTKDSESKGFEGLSHHVRLQVIESEHHIRDIPCAADFAKRKGGQKGTEEPEGTCENDADRGRRGRGGR